jgi:hypothetical protein
MPTETENWEQLDTSEQMVLLKMPSKDLANRFAKAEEFFDKARIFFGNTPQTLGKATLKPHTPPKDLVISARRDLSFFEAHFELFDNSIDQWRRNGAKSDLHITVSVDLVLNVAKYADDAGGIPESDVYKIFIPGETGNRDFSKPMIGSFGMGAKKAIFRLSDGAKVASGCSTKFAATSEVPEKWELNPTWETLDGRAKPIPLGTTEIYLLKLVEPPTAEEIAELIRKTSIVYGPLLSGELLSRKVKISVNETEVSVPAPINWSVPKGAEFREYTFEHTFENFLNSGQNVRLAFLFRCGLTRKLPGKGPETEADWGVDVYGNGRIIQRFLKDEFGFGTVPKLSKHTSGSKFFRGQLFINGHSFAIPWDTHKREYLRDHPVSRWLRDILLPVIRSYVTIAGKFGNDTQKRTTVLQASVPEARFKPQRFTIPTDGDEPARTALPIWAYSTPKKAKGNKHTQKANGDEDEEKDITISFTSTEIEEFLARFAVPNSDALAGVIEDCLANGVVFPLKSEELTKALDVFGCDGDVGQLCTIIKKQLLSKLTKS